MKSLLTYIFVFTISLQCVGQVSVQHSQPIKHILTDSFSNIFLIDFNNNLFRLSDNKIHDYTSDFKRIVVRQSLKRNNHFILDGQLKTIQQGEVKDLNKPAAYIYNNGNKFIEKSNNYIIAKFDTKECQSPLNEKIVDALFLDKMPFVLTENTLISICDNTTTELPFNARSMSVLNEESILISSLENGIWLYRKGRIKKYFTQGVTFPQQIKRIEKRENHVWILSTDKTLFNFNLDQQILKRVAVNVEDFVLDYWNKLWYATNQSIASNTGFINKKDPIITLDKIQLNDQVINSNTIQLSTHDKVSINYEIDYSPNLNLPLYYKWSYDSTWKTTEQKPLVLEDINPKAKHLELKTSSDGEYFTKPIKLNFETSIPFWGSYMSYILIGLLSLITLMVISHLRVSQKNKLLQSEKKALKLELEVTKKEQKLGQLQLNPHFIFNTMNSINGLIALDKKSLARKALSKFATIMRTVLSFSFDERINLEEELKFLNDYIKLEQLIREDLFEYNITSDLNQNIDIPPMIIQPFVENAIIHGLQHKGEKGQLDLTVEENGRYLKITITDNGIGRKAAQKYRKETHNSSAIKIVKDRIAKLDKWKLEEPITYIDLYNNDDAIGTKCILQIPK